MPYKIVPIQFIFIVEIHIKVLQLFNNIIFFCLKTATCDVEGKKAADAHNVCWYHQCVINSGSGYLDWIPRRCAWGTIMSDLYVEGLTNPCTINLDGKRK